MTFVKFQKKLDITETIIFLFISVEYYKYNNLGMFSLMFLFGIMSFISCLNKKYVFLEGIAIILYAMLILIIRIDLWPGALACIVIGLLILFFYQMRINNK